MSTSQETFRGIVEYYREKIESGEMEPGSQFPSRADMMQAHAKEVQNPDGSVRRRPLARSTADKVVHELASAGLVDLNPPPRQPTVADRGPQGALMRLDEVEVVSAGEVACPASVADLLGVEPLEKVASRKELGLSQGRPVLMRSLYYPDYVSEVVQAVKSPEPLPESSSQLVSAHLRLPRGKSEQEVYARPATTTERELLSLPTPAMVIEASQVVYLEDGRVLQVGVQVTEARRKIKFVGGDEV